MSLNGLEDPKLLEAYVAASAEPGGWLLLSYASRDEVELLSRGTGGISELRTAISDNSDKGALYGFLKYRRRNVIIKYLPDDSSRLVQARAAVHYIAVCERFAPNDTGTKFEITEPDGLRDTKLSAACSLHAAKGSNTSSTSSLRRRRLGEIVEEDEEEQRASKRQSLVQEDDGDDTPETPTSPSHLKGIPADPVKLDAELASSPAQSKFSADNTRQLPNFIGADDRPTSPISITSDRRMSSQTTRTETLGSYYSYPYSKPKIKLGPRPSLDVHNRPQTAGNFRPVSSVPSGYKLFGKGAKKGRSRDDARSPSDEIAETVFAPATPLSVPEEPLRPATSSGVSTTSTIMPNGGPSKPAMSREKARLKKAMQMREKKKQLLMQPTQPTAPTDTKSSEPELDSSQREIEDDTTAKEILDQDDSDKRVTMIKAESGIVLPLVTPSMPLDQSSQLTQTDSRPSSPIIPSSEADHSTKASSLSESTDETVQPKDDQATHTPLETPSSVEPNEASILRQDEAVQSSALDVELETAELEQDDMDRVETTVETRNEIPAVADASPLPAEDATVDASNENDEASAVVINNDGQVTSDYVKPTTLPSYRLSQDPNTMLLKPLCYVPGEVRADRDPRFDRNRAEKSRSDDQPSGSAIQNNLDTMTEEVAGMAETSPNQNIDIPVSSGAQSEPRMESEETSKTYESPRADATIIDKQDNHNIVNTVFTSLMVPKSKFSSPDLRGADKASPTIPDEPMPQNPANFSYSVESTPSVSPRHGSYEHIDTSDFEESARLHSIRKGAPVPIQTDISAQVSRRTSTNFSDDDALMSELQSATVQEARPMMVIKTPVTPVFPTTFASGPLPMRTDSRLKPITLRTVSNPTRGGLIPPPDISQSSARTVSSGAAAYLHQITQQQSGNMSTKGKTGSSITQRIKALEMLAVPNETAQQPGSRPSSTFFSVKSNNEPSRSLSVVERATSLRRQSPPEADGSRNNSPDSARRRDRTGSMASRLSLFESSPGANSPRPYTPQAQRGPDSVSVTARIVRDPVEISGSRRDESEGGHLDLRQSQLFVDHHVASPPKEQSPQEETIAERRMSRESRRSASQDGPKGSSRRSSLGVVKDFIKDRRSGLTSPSSDTLSNPFSPSRSPLPTPPAQPSNKSSHRLSISSRRSSFTKERENSFPSSITEGSVSSDETKSMSGDRKSSRAGRFMRRLSSLSSSKGKVANQTSLSPTVREEDEAIVAQRPATTTNAPSIVSYMGDVNVQFPDNLLWKRRNLCLDSQGFLILNALPGAAQGSRVAVGNKRYHLSQFRQPYVPDLEIQELPNSVVLDFLEGSGIQLACEDRAGQNKILSTLRDAHTNHGASFGI